MYADVKQTKVVIQHLYSIQDGSFYQKSWTRVFIATIPPIFLLLIFPFQNAQHSNGRHIYKLATHKIEICLHSGKYADANILS